MRNDLRKILALLTVIIAIVGLCPWNWQANWNWELDCLEGAEPAASIGASAAGMASGASDIASAAGMASGAASALRLTEIPEYTGKPYVEINGNVPEFDKALKKPAHFESYGELDRHRRCAKALACLCIETQPAATEERGDISSVHPSGWRSGMGWERCHLIGWQLCAENANRNNLVTGTHYMNVTGMLPFENRIDWYISDTGNHVLYSVEPVYKGKELVCRGVHMQAESVEDGGRGISFNVFCFNVSPGKTIDYKTGTVTVDDQDLVAENSFSRVYILNTSSMKFHYPSCHSVSQMAEHNKVKVTDSREALIERGYSPCGNCEP